MLLFSRVNILRIIYCRFPGNAVSYIIVTALQTNRFSLKHEMIHFIITSLKITHYCKLLYSTRDSLNNIFYLIQSLSIYQIKSYIKIAKSICFNRWYFLSWIFAYHTFKINNFNFLNRVSADVWAREGIFLNRTLMEHSTWTGNSIGDKIISYFLVSFNMFGKNTKLIKPRFFLFNE